jgi:chromosome partitioning protein
MPGVVFDPRSRGALAYLEFAAELERRLGVAAPLAEAH